MSTLLLDVGNSRIKWVWQHELSRRAPLAREHGGRWRDIWSLLFAHVPVPDRVWVSNVAGDDAAGTLKAWCRDQWSLEPVFARVAQTSCGVVNAYKDINQMGVDRWMALCGAWTEFRQACYVVDAGTALTVDVLNEQGVHQGGWIIPGSGLMIKALGVGTANVLFKGQRDYDYFGVDTAGCVKAGVEAALCGAVSEVNRRMQDHYINPVAVVTGGAREMIMRALPPEAKLRPALVMEGLSAVCESPS